MGGFALFATLGVIRRGTTFGYILIALAAILLICVPVIIGLLRRLSSTVENAAFHRPDAQIIPGYATGESGSLAAALGDTGKGWRSQGGNPITIAVSTDRVELWVRKEQKPRITLPTSQITNVGIEWGEYGARKIDTVAILTEVEAHTGTEVETFIAGFLFVPAYRPLRNMDGSDSAGMARAFQVLAGVGIHQTVETV